MEDVYRLAQELAEAIVQSSIYVELKNARATADASEELRRLEAEQRAQSEAVRAIAHTESGTALLTAIDELNARKATINALPESQRLNAARRDFDDMMENINRILRMVINGDPEGEAAAGCAGCAGCTKRG